MKLRVMTLVFVVAWAGGCLKSSTPTCGDTVCPGSLVCVRPNECIRAEVLAACEGKQENDVCDTPEGVPGTCGNGVCVPDTCGDGRVSFGEVCDGEDLGGYTCQTFGFYQPEGLKCSSECGFDSSLCGGICGDGIANGGELCDGDDLRGATCASLGYYKAPGLACSDSCFLDVSACEGTCGDGVPDPVEYCDGSAPAGDSCLTFGYGAGQLSCSKLCGADLSECHHVRWRTLETYSGIVLKHVWVGDGGEIVAVGDGGSVRLDGSTWRTDLFSPNFTMPCQAVWGLAANDLWATPKFPSGPGTVMRFNGTAWVTTTFPFLLNNAQLYDIWGTSSTNVYAVGDAGIIVHWDGTDWIQSTVGSDAFIRVLGKAANDIYALSSTELYHFDGSSWSLVLANPVPAEFFLDMWLDSTGQLYLARYQHAPARLNGTTLDDLPVSPIDAGVSPTPESVVGKVNNQFETLEFDGLTSTTSNIAAERYTRHGTKVYAPSDGRIYVLDGGTMSPLPDPNVDIVRSAWVSPSGNFYVAGATTTIAHHDGTGWSGLTNVGPGVDLYAIYGFGDNDLWVGGLNLKLLHCTTNCTTQANWQGITLTGSPQLSANDDVTAFWGRSSSDSYVSTAGGFLFRVNGATATIQSQQPLSFSPTAIQGSADKVFVVGSGGKIATSGTSGWTVTQTDVASTLRAVCVITSSDIWAVGDDAAVTHFNGTTWSSIDLPTNANFIGCAAYASNDVLMVAAGELWHWNGQALSPATPPFAETPVTAVAATPRGAFFVSSFNDGVGNATAVMHLFKPSNW